MKGVHEDRSYALRRGGSLYLYAIYRRGNIVRLGEHWGVVTKSQGKYDHMPYVTWWDECWTTAQRCVNEQLSAPYAHTYEGIPDQVVAKATQLILDTGYEHDTTDND